MNYEFDNTRKAIPQGDVYLVPIMSVPTNAKLMVSENGNFIVTHSETGHHHVVMERPDVKMYSGMDIFQGFLTVGDAPVALEHLRDVHKHTTQVVSPGAWLIQRQAAYTPQGWEPARD
jgi:hypothetical protein